MYRLVCFYIWVYMYIETMYICVYYGDMTGYGHTEFLKSLVTTYNPQEHAKTPISSYTPEYRILPKLNIPLSCSRFY